jgi:serine/threonine protein kinase
MFFAQFNVLIDGARNAVLCDFGIALIKDDVLSTSLGSRESLVSGTPSFMAPERLKGGSLRKPCDVYAFGMLIYEVCIFIFYPPLNIIHTNPYADTCQCQPAKPPCWIL